MAKKDRRNGALPLPVLAIMTVVILFAIYLSLSTLMLTFWGEETTGTVDGYTSEVDNSDSLSRGFVVTQSYVFTANGTEYRGTTVFNTHSPRADLTGGEIRHESITYLPLSPRINKPTALAGFSELGFFGVLRHIVLPLAGGALLVFVFKKQLGARAKPTVTAAPVAPVAPVKPTSAGESTFSTLSAAAEFAATLCSRWAFANTTETHDAESLQVLAQVHDEDAPADEGCFYIVSKDGAIGIACGSEPPDWLFRPLRPSSISHP